MTLREAVDGVFGLMTHECPIIREQAMEIVRDVMSGKATLDDSRDRLDYLENNLALDKRAMQAAFARS